MNRPRRRWSSAAVVAAVVTCVTPVVASNVRLERVVLLPSIDRSSVVLELSAAPESVSSRRISDSVIEVEASGVESAVPTVLKAPGNVRFVDSVTVRLLQTPGGPVVRARIALSSMAQTVVRSSGRRVYVDVSAVPKLGPVTPAPGAAQAAAASASATLTLPTAPPAEQAFRDGVRPSLDKLKELGPFLTSAASSGDPRVISALLPGLLTVRESLAALQPPDAARGSHAMVLGAVDRIIRGLTPDFSGDRVSTVKQSMTTIEVVGGVLAGE